MANSTARVETKGTDRIEKRVTLRAPVARVWKAIMDSKEFGRRVTGKIVGTEVDPEVAKMQEPYNGRDFDFTIDRIEPMRLFSFRWHPFAVEPGVDYSEEPTTLVVFELKEAPEGTLLTITESGFDAIPAARRAKAFQANEGGWEHQIRLVTKYLEREGR